MNISIETTAEMFAGIGGFRLAAERRGIKTLWANDLDRLACQVYRRQFGADVITEGDVNTVWQHIPRVDLLTGGFPCQPFSSAGKKNGTRDPRGTLFQIIVDVLARAKPDYFVLENVKRLLSMESGAHFATVLKALSELDYQVEWRLVNAMYLGLPQNRQRIVIIGRRREAGDPAVTVSLASRSDLHSVMTTDYDRLGDPSEW